jgi:hypothetical protein
MLRYTRHAKDRMRERGISEPEVEYCLNRYHTSYTDLAGNQIFKADLLNGKGIKVVTKADSFDPMVVITAAYYQ